MIQPFSVMFSILRIIAATLLALSIAACEQSPPSEEPGPVRDQSEDTALANPLSKRYLTPFRVPPFHQVEPGHFVSALESAIAEAEDRVVDIAEADESPTFDNTIAALERAGADVSRIARAFYGLAAVSPAADMDEIAGEISTLLARHHDAAIFNRKLFERVDQLHGERERLDLSPEQQRLLEEMYKRFERAGAALSAEDQDRLETVNARLAELAKTFDRTRQQATQRHEILIEDESRLEGLPESLVMLAARNARDRGHAAGWVFTLHAHSLYPFLRHFPDRELRQEIYEAWMARYDSRRDDNLGELSHRMAVLRAERARLLGHDSHLDYLLDDSTVGGRGALRELLDPIIAAAGERAERELAQLEQLAQDDGIDDGLKPWDWWYYAERFREQELEQSEMRIWFTLEQVREGAFSLANRLWGLSFHLRTDIPAWHLDVDAFEVRDAMGEHLGVIYLDLLHREGKYGGAWTSTYRAQRYSGDERVAPVVANVANFTPAPAGMPALLEPEEVLTLFHEFGHTLHGLLSDVRYRSLAGSEVPGDFVEFPALLFERWALEPEILHTYAYHHESGAGISDQAVEALQDYRHLTAGLDTLEYLAAIELDVTMHGATEGEVPTLEAAERRVAERLGLPDALSPRHYGNGLANLFSEPRRGADYRTLWSEILAADAFAGFADSNLIDRDLAGRLRAEILSRGNSRPPMASWHAFRGREPEIRYLLEARGLAD